MMEPAMRTNRRWTTLMLPAAVAALFALPAPALAQNPPEYEVTAVLYGPDCGGPYGLAHVVPWGLSNDGHVVGHYDCPTGYDHAFIWHGQGPIVPIPMPSGTYLSRAYDINSDGWVTGYYESDGHYGFLFDGTTTVTLEMPPGAVSLEPLALNDQRQVVGLWQWGTDAFLWEDGVCTDLGPILPGDTSNALDVNNAGIIAGWAYEDGTIERRAFLIDGDTVTVFGPIPGGQSSEAKAVSNQGHFAGNGILEGPGGDLVLHALYWDGEEMFNLGTLPGKNFSRTYDMNEDDAIVGMSSVTPTGQARAFMWRDGVMCDLNDLAETGSVELHIGMAINELGAIVCWAWDTDIGRNVAVVLAPGSPLLGDLDENGIVNVLDLLLLLGDWGPCSPPPATCPADLDGDGEVNTLDLLIMLGNWS